MSAWKGDRAKGELIEAELVREIAINPGGRGQQFKLLELSTSGRELLSGYGIRPSTGHGRGGVAHQWWVQTIASWLEQQGLSPVIEDDSSGVRVDVAVAVRRKRIAIEVEMAEGHALENISKDLEAGFKVVLSLVEDLRAQDRVHKKLSSDTGELPAGVLVGHLQAFEGLLAPLLSPQGSALRRPNQNQEPRRRRRPISKRPRTEAAADMLFEPGAVSTPLAADYLSLSPATLETLRSRGGGPTFSKLGRRVVYRREDLEAWLAERQRRSTSDRAPSD